MLMFQVRVLILAFLFSASGLAFAATETKADSQSTLKIEDAAGTKNKVKDGEDVDQIITNRKMRAEAGSKSKHSINSSLGYSGSTVRAPFKDVRPNLRGRADSTTVATFGGSVGYKYSITSRDAMKLGVGLRWITPVSGNEPPKGMNRSDVDNPYLIYQRVSKIGQVQNVLQFGPTLYTRLDLKAKGFASNWGVNNNMVYEIGKTKLSVGLLTGVSAYTFDKHKDVNKVKQSDYDVGFYPFMEYVINDRFNIRTISGLWTYSHARTQKSFWTLSKDTIYQSIGLGISVTRDIYLYPNVQFVPEDIRDERTNVALSTNINVF